MENNNKEESREFYVYKHIRKDNNTCFYVGKGKGGRIYKPKRNKHYNRIRKKYGCYVVKIKENLTEKEAFALEREIIEDYVFVFGYGINIDGYRDYDHEYLTNCTWGGEGTSGYKFSEKQKQKMSEKMKGKMAGKKNPMFGKNAYANKTPEEMEEIQRKKSESMKGKMAGENHPLYGKHHSEETKQRISEKNKGKNPYANKTPEEMEIIRRKMSENGKGKNAGKPASNRNKVICITTGKIFDCVKDASNYYNVARTNISKCCKGKIQSAGKLNGVRLQWKYAKDYNNEFKGILINPIINK